MSDAPDTPPQTPSAEGSRPRWLVPVVALVALALVAGVVAVLALGGGDDDTTTVALEPSSEDGPDPFTDSVSLVEFDGTPAAVADTADATIGELDTDGDTGTLRAPAATAGLYGGTRSDATCDVAQLETFLTDPDRAGEARAWAGVIGIETTEIPSYLAGLTPTVLTVDTRVTNHGFDGEAATPRQSVLQAGTAVLVDDLGVPRVRCSCGNPLTEPERIDLRTASTTGSAWSGYDLARVVSTVPAADPLDRITLVDVDDGSTFEVAPGSSATTWVAVAGDGTTNGRRGGAATAGSIHVSADGAQWEKVLDTDAAMVAVAHDGNRFVAVGARPDGGTIRTSDNGTTWSDPVQTEVGLVDVAVGDGTWVALAEDRTYTSTNGTDWTESAPIEFEFAGISAGSIAFGDGRFVVSTYSCGASGCSVTSSLSSTDGTTWTSGDLEVAPDGLRSPSLAFGDGFGAVGYDFGDAPADAPMVDIPIVPAASLQDGSDALVPVPQADGAPFLRGLSVTDGTWYAVGVPSGLVPDGPSGVYTSADLSSWSRVGQVEELLHDVVVAPGGADVAETEPPPADTTTTTAAPAGADVEITEAGFRAGGQDYATASTPASQARAALVAALGEPGRSTPIGGGVCTPGQYVWGELELVEFNESYWYFTLGSPNATGPSVADRVTTDAGIRLGDPIAQFQAAYPATRVIETDYGDTAYWADGSGDGKGLMAFASDGATVTSLSGGADDPTFIADC